MEQSNQRQQKANYSLLFRMILACMLMLIASVASFAQNTKVTGTVTDEKDAPIIGASVLVKGTSIGIITDIDGNFSINAPARGKLLISYIGYIKQEVPITGNKIKIVLKEDAQKLDEVVVVGYGTQKKSDLTGSVTSVKSGQIKGLSSGNAAEALQGKAGLFVTSMGRPGSAPVVYVRGVGTNGNASPLYVVDGVMVDDIQYLNSNDIESMDVLKDASATAIYGSRGANGVIMVTTKGGKVGKTTVTYNANEGFEMMVSKFDNCNGTEYAKLVNIMYAIAGLGTAYADPSKYGKETNWTNEISHDGWKRDHQLSVSGGSERIKYNLSVGYLDQKGVFKYQDYNRTSVRINNEYTINKNITFGHNLAFSNSNSPEDLTYRVMRSVYSASPLITPKDVSGNWNSMQASDYINPLAELYLQSDYNSNNLRFVGNVWGNWKIVPGLTFRSSLGEDWSHTYTDQFLPAYNINGSFQYNTTPSYSEYYATSGTWLWENTLTYDKKINDGNRLNLLAGYTSEKTHTRGVGATGKKYIIEDSNYACIASASSADRTVSTEYPTTVTRTSWMLRANYALKDRYLLTATLRADGSSKFGVNNRWGYFPSMALGWRIKEESFLKNADWLNNLKLRTSWGQTGNDKIANNVSYALATQADEYHAIFNGIYNNAVGILSAYNPNIKWERTQQYDLGFDASFLNNHLSFEFDYFTRDTKDLLMQLPIAGGSAGINPTYSNAGTVRNSGVEFTLRWQDNKHPFKYDIALNGSSFKNKVVDWGGQITTNNVWSTNTYLRCEKGQPLNYYYGYKAIGIYHTQAELDKWNSYAVSKGQSIYHSAAKLGDLIFEDVNGDGHITTDDQTNIGNPYPRFTGSLSFNASYKGFDVAMDWAGSFGAKIMNSFYNTVSGATSNMHRDWLDAWTTSNINASMPRLIAGSINVNNCTSLAVQNGDYLKLRNIELGYTLPQTLVKKINISKMRIFVDGTNLLYLTNYKGFSPEVGGAMGVDYNCFPIAGSFNFGVNLTF